MVRLGGWLEGPGRLRASGVLDATSTKVECMLLGLHSSRSIYIINF